MRLCLVVCGLLMLDCPGPGLASPAEDEVRHLILSRKAASRPSLTPDNAVNVSVGLSVVDVDFEGDKATISGWLQVEWTDNRLDWSERSGLNQVNSIRVRMWSTRSWFPDLQLLNPVEKANSIYGALAQRLVQQSGKLMSVLQVQFKVRCRSKWIVNVGNQLTCPIRLGSTLTSSALVDFWPTSDTLDMTHYVHSGPYELQSTSVQREETQHDCCPKPFTTLEAQMVFGNQ